MLQINRFMEEAQSLYTLLADCPDVDFQRKTSFKAWTVGDIIRHLLAWNKAAEMSARGDAELDDFLKEAIPFVMAHNLREFEQKRFGGLSGKELCARWWDSCQKLEEVFSNTDEKARLKWAGPDMSPRSSITARLMETWAHSQAIYDLFKVDKVHGEGLQDIADLGVRTFGWTFKNRKAPVPDVVPYVCLKGPDGQVWEWGDANEVNQVTGDAVDFCFVVTQARNVEDTDLKVTGPIACEWMAVAQCFAGPVETPPLKGARV